MAPPPLSNVQQAARDLQRAIRDLGPLASTRDLQSDLGDLATYCDGTGVDADIVVAATLTQAQAATVARWLSPSIDASTLVHAGAGSGTDVRVALGDGRSTGRVSSGMRPPAEKAGTPRPSVVVAVVGTAEDLTEDRVDVLGEMFEDRPLVMLLYTVAPAGPDRVRVLAAERNAVVIETANVDDLTADGLRARVETGPPPTLPLLLRGHAALYGVETAAETMRIVIDQEQRSVKVKRALAQQEAAKLQQPGANPMEVIGEMRAKMQRAFSEYERSVSEGMRSMFVPQVGTMTQAVDKFATGITTFEEKKGEKTIAVRLPDATEASYFALIRDSVRARCADDLQRMNDLFDRHVIEANRVLGTLEAPTITVHHAQLSELRMTRMLDSALRIDRPYRGELANPGVPEYVNYAKKYLGQLTAIGGLGVVSLAKVPFIPYITAGLVAWGIATTPKRIKRDRADNHARELDKARDILRGEAKRAFTEIEREWVGLVAEALKDEQLFIMQQFESAVREGQNRRTGDMAEEKRRMQRQMQGLDNTDKLLAAAKRTRDTIVNALGQLKTSMRQQLTAQPTAGAGARRPV
jgi:hypothetical protein